MKSESTKSTNTGVSTSREKFSSSSPTTATSSANTNLDNQTPTIKKPIPEPEMVLPSKLPTPLITAKADTQLQSSKKQIEGTASSLKPLDYNDLENRLRLFLQNYCTTYAAKDIDAFTRFFAPNASENGKPFESLVPKYQRNFRLIETIQYRIELQQFEYDDNEEVVKIDGNFFLKWLPPKKNWRENSGRITMSLRVKGASFLVQSLDYRSTHSAKNKPNQ